MHIKYALLYFVTNFKLTDFKINASSLARISINTCSIISILITILLMRYGKWISVWFLYNDLHGHINVRMKFNITTP